MGAANSSQPQQTIECIDDDNDNNEGKAGIRNERYKRSLLLNTPSISAAIASVIKPTINFMQCNITYYMCARRREPVIRVYGCTETGLSISTDVTGFFPYIFASVPANTTFTPEHCDALKDVLSKLLVERSHVYSRIDRTRAVRDVRVVKREAIMSYKYNEKIDYLRIELFSPKYVPTLRTILEGGFEFAHLGTIHLPTFEANIPFVLRFMIDKNFSGCSHLSLPAGSDYEIVTNTTHCQINTTIPYEQLEVLGFSGEWAALAPIRIMSYDIECKGRPGYFPVPEEDAIINIACVIYELGAPDGVYISKDMFTWRPSGIIHGVNMHQTNSEQTMLAAYFAYILEADPDLITGYNIDTFDDYYVFKRAEVLRVRGSDKIGRAYASISKIQINSFSSNAVGTIESRAASIDGRSNMDMLTVFRKGGNVKARSLKLDNMAAKFLGDQKEDVHYSIISKLWDGTVDDRRRLASYCVKDAILPLRLMNKTMSLVNNIEMARVTGVPFSYLLERGQSIKVISQILRFAREENIIIPTPAQRSFGTSSTTTSSSKKGKEEDDGGVCYEGATVLEPKRGFYPMPIVTLDFASLYPSIMMAHNLCYTTLLRPEEQKKLKEGEDYITTPSGDCFVRKHIRHGILPRILEFILAARKRAKQELAAETDPFKKQILDGRQLALKVTANSVYGFTGAARQGQLPCLQISASVTAFGREMIMQTKRLVEERYRIQNGYEYDAEVIYGDTDSVMIKFGYSDLAKCMELGREAAPFVSQTFVRPIQLEFEKCYYPYLLISKKRYAGLFWTKTTHWDKLDCKGIETVRRDNAPIIAKLLTECLDRILIHKDVNSAIQYAKSVISDLLQGKIDISELVISKSLSNWSPKNKSAHTELAIRMRDRDPASAPNLGDRIPYVVVRREKNAPAYQKAEDPIYVMKHKLPIDTEYYVEHQLRGPLERIFKAIMPNPGDLFRGDHMRRIHISSVPGSASGLGAFVTISETCIGCRVALHDGQKTLCDHCRSSDQNVLRLYTNTLLVHKRNEQLFAEYGTTCQYCQHTVIQKNNCSNNACPIFYARYRAILDVTESQRQLDRFSVPDF
jgi:DNA polymerase delta subunit 1